jgi:1-phosphofructokinase/tagatose 6-phosphate kinase
MGPKEAVVTLPDGCVARVLDGTEARVVRATVAEQDVRSATGSGDAFLAGYVAGRYSGAPAVECLMRGVACGAESTHHFGAGVVDPEAVNRLMDEISIEELQVPAVV